MVENNLDIYPERFDLEDGRFSFLFASVGCSIEGYLNGQDVDYKDLERAGNILKDFGESDSESFYLEFLSNIIEECEDSEINYRHVRDYVFGRGLDFLKFDRLEDDSKERLRDFSIVLSRKAREYRNYYFKGVSL